MGPLILKFRILALSVILLCRGVPVGVVYTGNNVILKWSHDGL